MTRSGPDRRALATTIAGHAIVLALVLTSSQRAPEREVEQRRLAVFDVAPPPSEPQPIPSRPEPEVARPRPVAMREAGGSPPRAASLPPPLPLPAMDRTATIAAPPMPLSSAVDVTAAPLLSPIALQRGEGAKGAGEGQGNGKGGDSGDGDPPYADAAWIVMPREAETRPYWPRRALAERLSGRVVLACKVPRPGPPRRCRVLTEMPGGVGFGKAAVAMSHLFRIRPFMHGKATVDLPIRVPVVFDSTKP